MKRLALVFEDALYDSLATEPTKSGLRPKEILVQALRNWLEAREDPALIPGLDEARTEWQREGGVDASEFFRAD